LPTYSKSDRQYVVDDAVLLVEGKISRRNGTEAKVLVNSVVPVSDDNFPKTREIHFTIDVDVLQEEKVSDLKAMLVDHEGDAKIFFHIKEAGQRSCIIRSKGNGVAIDFNLMQTLGGSLGSDNIRIVPSVLGP